MKDSIFVNSIYTSLLVLIISISAYLSASLKRSSLLNMSQSKLSLSVKGYEDVDDGNGTMMTMYIVRVEEASKNVYYVLKKRYTDFSRLYTALKERFPEIISFRFPNKSMFNTNAQFTKDRRRQGFDDFLKVIIIC